MALSFAERFAPTPENCNQILNAGSFVYAAPNPCGQDEPTVATISVPTAGVIGDETISLTSSITEGTTLRRNSLLHLTTGIIVVTADTLVTTATSVPIEALTVAIPDTDTATTWGMLALLSPTNIPFNIEASEVNRTDLTYDLQGSMVKSKIEVNNQISTIGRKDDRALYDYFFGASYTDQRIYTIFEYSDDTHGFGQSEIVGWNRDGNIEEITRPQFTAKLQAPFGIAKPFKWETTENQAALNAMRQLAGLSILTV